MPRHPQVSPFTQGLSDRVFGQLAKEAQALGKPFFPLHVGDTYLEPLHAAQSESQRTEDHPQLHTYAPVQGMPELLSAVQRKVERRSGRSLDRAQIQVMSGATAGLGVVCAALLSPGDEVLLPSPFWPLIRGIISGRGAVPVEVPIFHRLHEPGFDVIAALEAAVTPRTAALYLNTPHNPTGQIMDEALLRRIAEFARAHDLWIFSDEVYEDLYFDQPTPTMAAIPEAFERTLATHSVSKAYGLAGSRVGYTYGPAEVMETIRGVQTFYTYCAAKPLQLGAAHALEEGDRWLIDARARYGRAAALCAKTLGLPTPRSGTFLFFDTRPYRSPGESAMDFLRRAVHGGVMMTPGTACGTDFEDWARLCFTVLDEAKLTEAMRQLSQVLKSKPAS